MTWHVSYHLLRKWEPQWNRENHTRQLCDCLACVLADISLRPHSHDEVSNLLCSHSGDKFYFRDDAPSSKSAPTLPRWCGPTREKCSKAGVALSGLGSVGKSLLNFRAAQYPGASGAALRVMHYWGSCHKRQKPQAPTPQAPIRNRQTRKVANAKGLNRNTNLT